MMFLSVYGAIIGKQTGREVEIMNSFELEYEVIDNSVILSKEYYRLKEEQCKWQEKYTCINIFSILSIS